VKVLVPISLLTALALVGCAAKQQPVFSPLPGPFTGIAGYSPPLPPAEKKPVAEKKSAPSKKPALIVTPEKSLAGKVAVYNDAGRFVVLEFPSGQLPANEQRMSVYRRGLKVGEVKITGPQRDNHTVADLTAGEAHSGDEVRDR
jgi:hypothetical protein